MALAHSGATTQLDQQAMVTLRQFALACPAEVTQLFRWLTWVGDASVRTPAILLVAALLLLAGQRRAAVALPLASFVATLSSNGLLKPLLGRARPDIVPWWSPADGFSLPSGHATGAIAFMLIGIFLSRLTQHASLRLTLSALGMLLAIGIGLSRPWLGVHWPSDILAGWLWGGALATAAYVWATPAQITAGQRPA